MPRRKVVAAAEFLLEGLVAHRKLSRSEERGFAADENAAARRPERAELEMDFEDWQRARRTPRRRLQLKKQGIATPASKDRSPGTPGREQGLGIRKARGGVGSFPLIPAEDAGMNGARGGYN